MLGLNAAVVQRSYEVEQGISFSGRGWLSVDNRRAFSCPLRFVEKPGMEKAHISGVLQPVKNEKQGVEYYYTAESGLSNMSVKGIKIAPKIRRY